MGVRDKNITKATRAALTTVDVSLGTTAVSQAGTLVYQVTPKYPFVIDHASLFCTATAATASVDIQITGVSALASAITPVAATEVQASLGTGLVGGSSDTIQVKYTTNGTGSITNGTVTVWLRPFGMEGELKTKG